MMLRRTSLALLALAALAALTVVAARPLDPWGVFCGKTPCYDVLEVAEDADEQEIRKSYRKLARFWHPDKNPDPNARTKFEAIAKAYEVIGTNETRKKYDYMRKNPNEYYKQYGEHYEIINAPKTNLIFVLVVLCAMLSFIHWSALQQRYKSMEESTVTIIVAGEPARAGGSTLPMEMHKKAKQIYFDKDKAAAEAKSGEKNDKDKKMKRTEKLYKKDPEFRKVVATLVGEMADLDKGYTKPAITDIFLFQIVHLPAWLLTEATWQVSFAIRHSTGKGTWTNGDKVGVLKRALHPVWPDLTEEEQQDLIDKEAYLEKNLPKWRVKYQLAMPEKKDKSKKRR